MALRLAKVALMFRTIRPEARDDMPDSTPPPTRLADYTAPDWLVAAVELTFWLAPPATRVLSRIRFKANPTRPGAHPLRLDGEELRLISARVDGQTVTPEIDAAGLSLPANALPEGGFIWEAEVEIAPAANTALEGLYISKGMYCTQCEAQGFRKITYYPDRPDVMARFTVRIESDLPVLLSNGNPTASGPGWMEYHDPWPKPAYLFALVAGDLVAYRDTFITASKREVALAIWVRAGNEERCAYAMGALKRAMHWDEQTYGREYDLDIFNIVAVDDFNMGAMENKSLNIFNSKYVLASRETATDDDFARIEGVIAHEYFHNWTGDRITCRDWFQLCLKEGLTVFRDQSFSAAMRSAPVKRIEDVLTLRARQFREDNGPLAHPVRPESYIEINNFYTATIYEKGAEIIRMLKRLVGDAGYRKALDLYFSRHDGQAATIEDWLGVFEDATGRDLTQFKRWYSQPGTPRLHISDSFKDGIYTLHIRQETPPTPGYAEKAPLHMPLVVGLLNPNGDEVLATQVLELTKAEQSFTFSGLAARPVPSLNRDFSAPVIIVRDSSAEERAFLLAHDTDPFNRWEAGRALARDVLAAMVTDKVAPGPDYLDALARIARDTSLDPAFRALALRLPGEDDLAQSLHDAGHTPDPLAIHAATERLRVAVARHLAPLLPALDDEMRVSGAYSPNAADAGRRALGLAALGFLTRIDGGTRAERQFVAADNMTEQFGALTCLLEIGKGGDELAQFYRQWRHDPLVIDKWFAAQVSLTSPRTAASTAKALTKHADFDWKNPNRFRSVIGALAMNPAGFHDPTGASYRLIADWLIRLDPLNPQTTARMSAAFETWARYDADRQALMRAELKRIAATPGLSRDTGEMVARILGS